MQKSLTLRRADVLSHFRWRLSHHKRGQPWRPTPMRISPMQETDPERPIFHAATDARKHVRELSGIKGKRMTLAWPYRLNYVLGNVPNGEFKGNHTPSMKWKCISGRNRGLGVQNVICIEHIFRPQGTQIRRMRAARVKVVIEMDSPDRNFPGKA